ncbi:MAG: N-acetylmuramoyl-L-alanine amidase [Dysgonamonadaceae bacterium]|jgi:N-acetylmuramoyl-L-alanine amidase|nr:N-acetylmuramoyl-L-alanine amidase [Dysgonamonadaceae bacterium]
MMNLFKALILFFVALLCFDFPVLAASDEAAFVLVIDPGHGGKDTGAVGRRGREKDINLGVALKLGDFIKKEHPEVKIIFTRRSDVFIELNERANIANKANANLFISVHTNSAGKKSPLVCGAEVYTFGIARTAENLDVAKRENSVILLEDNYATKYEGFDPNSDESYIIFEFMQNKYVEQSVNFASTVQKELVKTGGRRNRGVRQAAFLVLRKSTMPRILVELDFISNREAEDFLLSDEGQRTMAKAISNAFSAYKKSFDKQNSLASLSESGDSTDAATAVKPQIVQTEPAKPAITVVAKDTAPVAVAETVPAAPAAAAIQKPKQIFKVQILAVPKKLPARATDLKGYKAEYYIEKGLYKYTYGESTDWAEINRIRQKISKDFKDAFIVTFEDGKKVPNPYK